MKRNSRWNLQKDLTFYPHEISQLRIYSQRIAGTNLIISENSIKFDVNSTV